MTFLSILNDAHMLDTEELVDMILRSILNDEMVVVVGMV